MHDQTLRTADKQLVVAIILFLSPNGILSADGVPVLVKTNQPIRIEPEAAQPAIVVPPVKFEAQRDDADRPGIRVHLEPDGWATLNHRAASGGVPRVNRFVELTESAPMPATRSAAVPQRATSSVGEVRVNRLFVDAPPKLRRFDVEQNHMFPKADVGEVPSKDALVPKNLQLPTRPVEDLDEAVDALALGAVKQGEQVREVARDGGLGMLAIDQIGRHLELDELASRIAAENAAEKVAAKPQALRDHLELPLPPSPENSGKLQEFRLPDADKPVVASDELPANLLSPLPSRTELSDDHSLAGSLEEVQRLARSM